MRVFLYGTLRRGGCNAHRMAGAEFVSAGTVTGRLIRVDWYPGLVPDPQGDPVSGELWELSREMLAALDRYEGCDPESGIGEEYRRVLAMVRLEDGATTEAWVWEWVGPTDGYPLIEGGDWLG